MLGSKIFLFCLPLNLLNEGQSLDAYLVTSTVHRCLLLLLLDNMNINWPDTVKFKSFSLQTLKSLAFIMWAAAYKIC